MKIKDILTDAATVAGCCVGVGFLSGKEAQNYFGNYQNIAVFAAVFLTLTLIIREFCRTERCYSVDDLSRRCFGRGHGAFTIMYSVCSFVCLTTALAGVGSCLNMLIMPLDFPLYAIVASAIALLVMRRGIGRLKVANTAALVIVAVYLICAGIVAPTGFTPTEVSATEPLKYALFSVTVSLGVTAKLTENLKDLPVAAAGRQNVLSSVTACAVFVALSAWALSLCDFSLEMPILSRTDNLALNLLGGLAVISATVTCIAANALPIVENVRDVFDGDESLCYVAVFCTATAFSMFGFDFALRYGYLVVAAAGIAVGLGVVISTLRTRPLPWRH